MSHCGTAVLALPCTCVIVQEWLRACGTVSQHTDLHQDSATPRQYLPAPVSRSDTAQESMTSYSCSSLRRHTCSSGRVHRRHVLRDVSQPHGLGKHSQRATARISWSTCTARIPNVDLYCCEIHMSFALLEIAGSTPSVPGISFSRPYSWKLQCTLGTSYACKARCLLCSFSINSAC